MRLSIIGASIPDLAPHVPVGVTSIVIGGFEIDAQAAEYAASRGLPLFVMRPDPVRFGRAWPIVRNRELVDACDTVLAFWAGTCRSTGACIVRAEAALKRVKIINPMELSQ